MTFNNTHKPADATARAKRIFLSIAVFFAAYLSTTSAWAQASRTFVATEDSLSSKNAKKNDTLSVAKVWKWSLIAPSFGQFFNHHYWKTPIVIGGIGGFAYAAYASKTNRAWYILGAGAVYWASLLDATACYRYDNGIHSPSKAAIYATLLPGLGQAYNQKYWKLPLVYGGFLALGYLIQSRNFRLNLFGNAYLASYELGEIQKEMSATTEGTPEYSALQEKYNTVENRIDPNLRMLSMDRLKSYRDVYRRDRDFYIILTCLWYGLTIIDAVVDAHFFTYDVSNDLSFQWSPYMMPASQMWARTDGVTAGVVFNIKF
jgi:hypothetical protein